MIAEVLKEVAIWLQPIIGHLTTLIVDCRFGDTGWMYGRELASKSLRLNYCKLMRCRYSGKHLQHDECDSDMWTTFYPPTLCITKKGRTHRKQGDERVSSN